ncbi:hypothetical protein [Halovivax cerinus]|uniref:Uncharacterized protein n=1 Tax=Halovivax cerinus TaxID=1487865 RepID=A0ABD5NP39_9EURY|nr:hypothetical protein [Halovivax cerinus]
MTGFVLASSLYDVETRTSVPHPASEESPEDRDQVDGPGGDLA